MINEVTQRLVLFLAYSLLLASFRIKIGRDRTYPIALQKARNRYSFRLFCRTVPKI